ncbi:hypothetical protein PLICRDRAFT_193038 [Plicaturopsis crispa FD-325 SS-3]|nr:hypothetical protein PLICRDRAFT_193038 [Plicaturopsis crispa FD-325 SS-3]
MATGLIAFSGALPTQKVTCIRAKFGWRRLRRRPLPPAKFLPGRDMASLAEGKILARMAHGLPGRSANFARMIQTAFTLIFGGPIIHLCRSIWSMACGSHEKKQHGGTELTSTEAKLRRAGEASCRRRIGSERKRLESRREFAWCMIYDWVVCATKRNGNERRPAYCPNMCGCFRIRRYKEPLRAAD